VEIKKKLSCSNNNNNDQKVLIVSCRDDGDAFIFTEDCAKQNSNGSLDDHSFSRIDIYRSLSPY
jgi:hypothetical protein